MEQSGAAAVEFALEGGLEAVLGVAAQYSLPSSTSLKTLPFKKFSTSIFPISQDGEV